MYLAEVITPLGGVAARLAAGRPDPADAYGRALVVVCLPSSAVLNTLQRASIVTRGAYSGKWILRSP